MSKMNILVLGSGVSGLTTAMTILQSSDHQVTIWTPQKEGEFSLNSSEAFGIWLPQRDKRDQRMETWAKYSLKVFTKLAEIPDSGVSMMPVQMLFQGTDKPWFASDLKTAQAEAEQFTRDYGSSWIIERAPVIDPSMYLAWLEMNVVRDGAHFVTKTAENLTDFPDEFDLIINCTGLGSIGLAGDSSLRPARLQVLTVKNKTKFNRVVVDEEGPNQPAYIVPQGNTLRLGTVYEENVDSTSISDTDTDDILARCSRMVPGLKFTRDDVVKVHTFLCPVRDQVRMEPVGLSKKRSLIHNYGHHKTGYITSHGIARDIANLIGK